MGLVSIGTGVMDLMEASEEFKKCENTANMKENMNEYEEQTKFHFYH